MFDLATTDIQDQFADLARRSVQAHNDQDCTSVKFTDLAPLLNVKLALKGNLKDVSFPIRRIKPGCTLYRAGDKFNAIYVIRSGFLKTVSVDTGGDELVLGFPMGGDVVGLEGVDSGCHTADVVALDLSTAAVITFARLAQLVHEHACIERLVYSVFSRQLVETHGMVRMLGTLSAEARLASFLLGLADRFGALGYSRTSFTLRMTRQEIGSHLGMKLETVSRTLSAFAAAGLIAVDRRTVALFDVDRLRRIREPQREERAGVSKHRSRPANTSQVRRATLPLAWMSLAAA